MNTQPLITLLRRFTTVAALAVLVACGASKDGDDDPQVPAQTPKPVTQTINAATGGTISGLNGVTLSIPPAALQADTAITIAFDATGAPPLPTLPEGATLAAPMLSLTPHGTTFSVPVTLTLLIDPAKVPADATPLLFKTNPQRDGWEQIGAMRTGNTLTAAITSFSHVIIAGPGSGSTPPPSFSVGGAVLGLSGSGLVLQNNGTNNLTISTDGNFSFSTALTNGSSYSVTVAAQPDGQTCSVTNGSGTINGANVMSVRVSCSALTYTVGGTVSGLTGSLVLQNNGGNSVTVNADGGFTFTTALANGADYSVSVASQPPGQTCAVTGGTGTGTISGANVSSVQVNCATAQTYSIGGMVTGLGTGKSLVLRNNGADDRTITTNGPFGFAATLANSANYSVAVATPPAGQTCLVTDGSGTVSGANVTNVQVNCVTPTYTLGGTVSGLANGAGLVLVNRVSSTEVNLATVSANGGFTFTTALATGASYDVSVITQPSNPAQTCVVDPVNSSGTIANANVSVVVNCTTNSYTLGGSVAGLGSGNSVVLQNNGGNNLTVSANGDFTFAIALASSSTYNIAVFTQPTGQACTVANGSGTVGSANVSNIQVICTNNPVTYGIGGSVSGLSNTGLVLQNNGGDNLTISFGNLFTFATTLANGSTYNVSVANHPTNQTCSVANGAGIVSGAHVTDVTITCSARTYTIGGTVSGLGSARSAVLLVRAGNESTTLVANGAFAFPTRVFSGLQYNVTITTPPLGQRCTVTNGSGTVSTADIANIAVDCGTPVADNWVTNGTVNSSALSSDGNTIYITGNFTRVGPRSGGGVPINANSGAPAASYPRVEGVVHASASDNAGGWYIGGVFKFVGGIARNNIAHILADGNVDTAWNPDVIAAGGNVSVNAIVVSGQTVYVGGDFTHIGGQARNALAALDATTGLATAWNAATAGGGRPSVRVLRLSGQTLYVGGNFTSIGGAARNNLAALGITTGLATAWNPGPGGSIHDAITSIELSGQTVYIGGSFSSIGGQLRNNLAAVDATTGLAINNWNPAPNDYIVALAVSGQTLYAAGRFTTIGGQNRTYFAAINTTTGLATAWNPMTFGPINMLAISGQTLYVGGKFEIVGRTQANLAAVDTTTGQVTSWSPEVNDSVTSIGIGAQTLYLGGNFSLVGGMVRNYAAALNTSTGVATAWNPDPNQPVKALAVSGQAVYVGGGFTHIGGQARAALAALDGTTGLVTGWNPDINYGGFPGTVSVGNLALSGQTVYFTGTFRNAGGQPRNNGLAALDTGTGLATAWNPTLNGSISTLVASGANLYVGGSFTSIAGTLRTGGAAFDTTTGLLTGWNPSLSALNNRVVTVSSISVSGSTAHIAGSFNNNGGQVNKGITAVDASSGAPLGWNPYPTEPFLSLISTVVSNGQDVYLGGSLVLMSTPEIRRSLVSLNASTGLATDWNPQISATSGVFSLTVSNGVVYAGGGFNRVGNVAVGNFAFLPR